MAETGIIWHGMDEFISSIHRFTGDVDSMLDDSAQAAAEATVDEARPEVPVLTGAAADSLRVMSVGMHAHAAVGGEDIAYYGWLEFGGTAGHIQREIVPEGRYLFPAYEKVLGDITEIMEDALTSTLELSGLVVDNA